MENSNKSYENTKFRSKKEVICYLLKEFYKLGWCTGSGGGISVKESDNSIWLAPSGVHKEFVEEDDLFNFDLEGKIISNPITPNLKVSECTPLFLEAYRLRNAGAVLHSHSVNAVMVTKIFGTEFQCIDYEMIKGIDGHKNTEWCRVPIIENTERECELTESLRNAITSYPRSHAVLVRNHGVYIWGSSWEKAKIHAECYEYLFKAVLECRKYNINIETTQSSDSIIRSWLIDESKQDDIRKDLHYKDPKWVKAKELEELGILVYKLDGNEVNEELEAICNTRGYKNRDQVKIGLHMENYDAMIKKFATEHLHEDEEIRYILAGSGYFDVRNKQDQWVRIQVIKGHMIILPERIYHRFSPDVNNSVHAMRLFTTDPKWTPINRYSD